MLLRNSAWNIIGNILPLFFAIISIPFLIKFLGTDRFGILTLAWVIIGYFSLFDLGLGRALTKMVAQELGAGNEYKLPGLVWTTLSMMLLLGISGMLVLLACSSWLTYDLLKIPIGLQHETFQTLILLAISIPIVIITSGLRGVLEAKQCFGLVNAMRVPLGMLMYAGPLLVLPFSHRLQPVILVLLVVRIVGMFVHFKLCLHVLPCLKSQITFQSAIVKPLFSLGGWMTLSNVVGPLMVYADRFLISGFVSVAAAAYYTTPFEVITKLMIIPTALVGVLFPAFSSSLATSPDRTLQIYKRSLSYTFIIFFPITMFVLAFSPEGLTLWLGSEFASNSTNVLRWITVGVFISSFAQIPFTLIQSAGRPDITAKFHLIQLPFYLIAVWLLIKSFGVEGAAIAWVLRIVVDTMLLFCMARRLVPKDELHINRYFVIFVFSLISFYLISCVSGIVEKIELISVGLILFSLIVWLRVLSDEEKTFFKKFVKYGARTV